MVKNKRGEGVIVVPYEQTLTAVESLSFEIGKFIFSTGRYKLANSDGLAIDEPNGTGKVSILHEDPNATKWWWKYIAFKRRRAFLGCIYLESYMPYNIEANVKSWVFHVYGQEYEKEAQQLAKEMAEAFNVKITIKVISKKPYFERRGGDFSSEW